MGIAIMAAVLVGILVAASVTIGIALPWKAFGHRPEFVRMMVGGYLAGLVLALALAGLFRANAWRKVNAYAARERAVGALVLVQHHWLNDEATASGMTTPNAFLVRSQARGVDPVTLAIMVVMGTFFVGGAIGLMALERARRREDRPGFEVVGR